jgi:hypothetical protein
VPHLGIASKCISSVSTRSDLELLDGAETMALFGDGLGRVGWEFMPRHHTGFLFFSGWTFALGPTNHLASACTCLTHIYISISLAAT